MEPMRALPPGTMVYGADDQHIGTVESADDAFVVVETGGVPPHFYVPMTAIVETREDGAYLSVTWADARNQGWDREPAGTETTEELGQSGYSAIQAEDSLDDDHDAMPVRSGTHDSGASASAGDLERPSGATGPVTDGER